MKAKQTLYEVRYGSGQCAVPGCARTFRKRSANHKYCSLRCSKNRNRERIAQKRCDARLRVVAEAYERGLLQREIAIELGVSHQRVTQLVRRARERGLLAPPRCMHDRSAHAIDANLTGACTGSVTL